MILVLVLAAAGTMAEEEEEALVGQLIELLNGDFLSLGTRLETSRSNSDLIPSKGEIHLSDSKNDRTQNDFSCEEATDAFLEALKAGDDQALLMHSEPFDFPYRAKHSWDALRADAVVGLQNSPVCGNSSQVNSRHSLKEEEERLPQKEGNESNSSQVDEVEFKHLPPAWHRRQETGDIDKKTFPRKSRGPNKQLRQGRRSIDMKSSSKPLTSKTTHTSCKKSGLSTVHNENDSTDLRRDVGGEAYLYPAAAGILTLPAQATSDTAEAVGAEDLSMQSTIRSLELRVQGQLNTIRSLEQQLKEAHALVEVRNKQLAVASSKLKSAARQQQLLQVNASADESVRLTKHTKTAKEAAVAASVEKSVTVAADMEKRWRRAEERCRSIKSLAEKLKLKYRDLEEEKNQLMHVAQDAESRLLRSRKANKDIVAECTALKRTLSDTADSNLQMTEKLKKCEAKARNLQMALEHSQAELRNQRHEMFLLRQQHEQSLLEFQINFEKKRTERAKSTLGRTHDDVSCGMNVAESTSYYNKAINSDARNQSPIHQRRLSAERFMDLSAVGTDHSTLSSGIKTDCASAIQRTEEICDEEVKPVEKNSETASSNSRNSINRVIMEGYSEEKRQNRRFSTHDADDIVPQVDIPVTCSKYAFEQERPLLRATRGSSVIVRDVPRTRSPSPIVKLIRQKAHDIIPLTSVNGLDNFRGRNIFEADIDQEQQKTSNINSSTAVPTASYNELNGNTRIDLLATDTMATRSPAETRDNGGGTTDRVRRMYEKITLRNT